MTTTKVYAVHITNNTVLSANRTSPSKPPICSAILLRSEPPTRPHGTFSFVFSINSAITGSIFCKPPARKPLPRVRKPNLHSDRGQDSNPCAWRSLGPQSAHGSTVPRRPLGFNICLEHVCLVYRHYMAASFLLKMEGAEHQFAITATTANQTTCIFQSYPGWNLSSHQTFTKPTINIPYSTIEWQKNIANPLDATGRQKDTHYQKYIWKSTTSVHLMAVGKLT
ncbi:hypothetical protein E2C01_006699 [Portunus trituberculatus]|uniref:Uncharacterized protein n=1 Tax=Portunus trituberculatus TaxID=210409 RepID=A0A5B7CX10_PORTR|nr:hypothetical protein [Portunus trituberculatus]